MAGATQPETLGLGVKRKVHHTYIWLGGLGAAFWLVVVLGAIGAGIMGELFEDGDLNPAALGLSAGLMAGGALTVIAMAVGLGIGLRALSYRHLWYELDSSELGVYSGIISKKRTHVPYQKIQSIDLKMTLVQRILGVCNVVIDTAGGASNKAVVIPYLSKQDAQALKSELFQLKNASVAGAPIAQPPAGSPKLDFAPPSGQPVPVAAPMPQTGNVLDIGSEAWEQFGGVFASQGAPEPEAASFEYGLSNKEILLTGISNSSGVIAGVVGAIIGGLATIVPILGSVASRTPGAYETVSQMAWGALHAFLPAVVLGVLALALVIWVLASGAACIQYGGFRARRRGTRIEVERGLLQHNSTSLDIERVQSVIVKQSFIRRLIGYCELSLGKVSAAEPGSGQDASNAKSADASGFVIHPFLKLDRVDEVLHGMVPEYADLPADEERLAPVALRRGLVRRCVLFGGGFWVAVVTALAQWALHALGDAGALEGFDEAAFVVDGVALALYVVAAIVLVFDVVDALLWFRDSRFAMARRMVSFTNGGLSKDMVAVPRTKVQFASAKTNPLQRRAGTSTVAATTAAGIGGTRTALVDVSADAAERWLGWAEPHRP